MTAGTPALLTVDEAVDALRAALRRRTRVLAGLTGAPAAGKSTLAARLAEAAEACGLRTVVVPMDGFHLAQEVLDARGWGSVKGAPHTFDAAGYVALLRRLRGEPGTVWAPEFDRSLEQAIAGAIEVGPQVQVVITEGNYLLLDGPPWDGVRPLLDLAWYVEAPDELRRQRLIARHEHYGRSRSEATDRALGTDERNAALVRASRGRASAVIRVE
ncbi:nucleoside/nucleotide kinase family protein [Flexivirga meconopsidis]|uniref:nucleoside/nucleotide kinase family protein n=1 Tax=Flexivirga meconopsidis TaxID=2977121 RepID=UPI00223F3569|nr:nucleoside/nucleotide kinase family protein [Flexivirga meconopsidis]